MPKLVQRDIPGVDQLRGVAGAADRHSFERPTAEGSGGRQKKETSRQARVGGKKTFNLCLIAKERLGLVPSTRFTNTTFSSDAMITLSNVSYLISHLLEYVCKPKNAFKKIKVFPRRKLYWSTNN